MFKLKRVEIYSANAMFCMMLFVFTYLSLKASFVSVLLYAPLTSLFSFTLFSHSLYSFHTHIFDAFFGRSMCWCRRCPFAVWFSSFAADTHREARMCSRSIFGINLYKHWRSYCNPICGRSNTNVLYFIVYARSPAVRPKTRSIVVYLMDIVSLSKFFLCGYLFELFLAFDFTYSRSKHMAFLFMSA